jgi:hypothetical protein
MHPPFASLILSGPNLNWLYLPVVIAVVITIILSLCSRSFVQRGDGARSRDWLPISASIDVVTVLEQTTQGRSGESTIGYLGTLTYFYRNPELQMGEYSRFFEYNREAEAQKWVADLKGKNVIVYVDPRDPTRSELREEGLREARVAG